MVPELEKAHVTELNVRMDCHGCVQKIKKAMHNIDGVYSAHFDVAQQKLTVIGTAEPEKIVKAIKKTRKTATICSHTVSGEPSSAEQQQPAEPAAPAEPATSSEPPATDAAAANPPATEAPPVPENKPEQTLVLDVKPSAVATDSAPAAESKEIAEIHMVHHYPNSYVHTEHWNYSSATDSDIRYEPVYSAVSYSNYRPSPYVSQYGYVRSPQPEFRRYISAGGYSDGYYHNRNVRTGNMDSSIFSDENPNACIIV